jgi:hypothetical protein
MSHDDTPGRVALDRALERWRRSRAGGPSSDRLAGAGQGLAELARRLDDSGCAYGRVSAARIDHLTRAYDRLETKLNAVLMAVVGTFLSTLASLLLYVVRGSGH